MTLEKSKSKQPGTLAIVADAIFGVLLGALIAVVWLMVKPVMVTDAPPPPDRPGEFVDHHRVLYYPGRQSPIRNSEWTAKQRAFITSTPGSLQILEQDVNRWISVNFGETDRTVKVEMAQVEVVPELPVFRFDGNKAQAGMIVRAKILGLERRIVLQAQGDFVKQGQRHAFVPRTMFVGSCPVPVSLGGGMLYRAVADGFVVSEAAAKAWAQVDDIKVENSRMRVAIR